jgi:ATP-dependent DNA helicase DinG
MTPLNIAEAFQERKNKKPGSWVYTSATLAVANSFDYFAQGLGIFDYESVLLQSPFDYQKQALMYLPAGLPDPNSDNYTKEVFKHALQVLKQSQGRAFLLFTSFRALNIAHDILKKAVDYPLLVQGDGPRDQLLDKFRITPNAILLGTNSFWEGVDVRGEALVCVVIDKLPFAAPNDPVFQARLDALKSQGLNPFMHYQLPKAVIMLKQGVGRLIRDESDYGVLMICDPRLKSKAYGKTFLNSLPDMQQTSDIADVVDFYQVKNPTRESVA